MILQKKYINSIITVFAALFVLWASFCTAQTSYNEVPANRYLLLAAEQFAAQHYTMAAQSARLYLAQPTNKINAYDASGMETANYYIAIAALKANVPNCTDSAENFLKITTNPAYRQRTSCAIAQYYFLLNKLSEAIPWYEAAGIDNLNNSEIGDQKFEMAYCYFNNKQFDKAQPLLVAMIALKDGKYYKPGNYYYGLLAYNENRYNQALECFEKIKYDKDYKLVVPYYVAEIYYFQGNKAKALETALYCLGNTSKNFYENELHLLAAQCLFEDEKYADARPHFAYYYEHTDKIKKEDLYKMAYCDYRLSMWQPAIEKFKQLNSSQDSLGQSSMYILGDCYLKSNDKAGARNAFGYCAEMDFNPTQQEASMILYAKISYDMGYDDDAMRQVNNLLTIYPGTRFRDEANTMISDLLLKTNHFAEAVAKLSKVKKQTDEYWLTWQKANFDYAVQLFRNGDAAGALEHINASLKHPIDEEYEYAAYFWKGELSYRLHNYTDVITYSQNFVSHKNNKINIEHISPLATLQHAYLNMGFAAMETHNYNSAQNYFNKAQQAIGKDDYSVKVANLREADAVFMQKNFQKAIVLYDKVAANDNSNADYAHFQKSIILGLQGKINDKIALLQSIIDETPPSTYANEAGYEIAITYIEEEKYPSALEYLRPLDDSMNDKSLVPGAYMKKGFVYQQLNLTDSAIDAYKHIVAAYPASDERPGALNALRSIYIQKNQPAAYSQLLKDNQLPAENNNTEDSTYYTAAETQFSLGKWQEAQLSFTNYLTQFPNGIFAVKAHYYRAESEYQLKDYAHARDDFNKVLTGPWNDFSENSAKHAASISYDQKEYDTAFHYFSLLEENTDDDAILQVAYEGMMKSSFNVNNFSGTQTYADSLLQMPEISAETINDALLYKAKSLQHFKMDDSAIAIYKQLSENKSGEMAAEARYRIAEIFMDQNRVKGAEDAANETIKLSAGYDYWIVKSYLLLADVLVRENDYFNAKATLESVVKHTKIEELKDEAIKKLEAVKKTEKQQSKLSDD